MEPGPFGLPLQGELTSSACHRRLPPRAGRPSLSPANQCASACFLPKAKGNPFYNNVYRCSGPFRGAQACFSRPTTQATPALGGCTLPAHGRPVRTGPHSLPIVSRGHLEESKTRTPMVFMVFRFWDVSMTPKTNYFKLWEHQNISNDIRKDESILQNNILGNLKILEIEHFICFWKRQGPQNPEDPSNIVLAILNMVSTSIQKT